MGTGSSVIGALRVTLGMDSAAFSTGAQRTTAQLKTLRTQFLAVSAAATALGAAFYAMARNAMTTIDAQAKLARAVGGTTSGLQALERAADRSGVQQSELGAALTRLNQVLGKSIVEGKGTEGVFKKLGISAQDLAKMDVDERMASISRAMLDAGLSTQEMALYLRELGIRQSSVITLMQGGAAEIERSRSAIDELGVAVSDIDAAKIEAANDSLAEVGRVFEGFRNQLAVALAPMIQSVADAFTNLALAGGPVNSAIRALIDNLGRLTAYVSTAVSAFGIRYVGAFVAARVATMTLSGSLAFLRGALIRTGIGALIVGAGELVFQFTRLVSGVGSFGEAFSHIGAIASELFDRLLTVFQGISHQAFAASLEIVASMAEAAVDAGDSIAGFATSAIGIMRGTMAAVREIWSRLPAAIGEVAIGAANAMISGVESMLNGVGGLLNSFIERVNSVLSALPDWATGGALRIGTIDTVSLERFKNEFEGAGRDAGAAVKAAFNRSLISGEPIMALDIGLGDGARVARERASVYRNAANDLRTAARAPLGSLDALRQAIAANTETTDTSADALRRMNDALEDTAGVGGGKADKAAEKVEKVKDALEETNEAADILKRGMASAFEGILDGSKSLTESLAGIARQLGSMFINKGFDSLFSNQSSLGGIGNAISGLFGGGARTGGGIGSSGFMSGVGGFLSNLKFFADGTDFAPGGWSVVGEEGPELLNLPRGSRVFDTNETRDMLAPRGRDQVLVQLAVPQGVSIEEVRQISGNVAVQVVSSAAVQQRRALPGQQSDAHRRGL